MRDGFVSTRSALLEVFALYRRREQEPDDILPFLPIFHSMLSAAVNPEGCTFKSLKVPVTDVECITSTTLKTLSKRGSQDNGRT